MKKGTHAPASMSKPTEGAMGATTKVKGGKVEQPYTAAARPGKKVKK